MDFISHKIGSKFAIFIGIIALIGCAWSKRIIDCPVSCPVNVYKPICSRGKSYANLCVLKQVICQKHVAQEVYEDIEACPGYDKMEDETGASVEAVDTNGVVFRGMFDEKLLEEKSQDNVGSTVIPVTFSQKSNSSKTRPCHRSCSSIKKCGHFREVLHASRCWMKYHKCKRLSRKCCHSEINLLGRKEDGKKRSLLKRHRSKCKVRNLRVT